MHVKQVFAWLVALFALVAAAGCGGDGSGGGGSSDGGGSGLPSIPTVWFTADGGNATTGAATNGGTAGAVSFSADLDILFDDDRPRPAVAGNFLTPVLGNDPITYADLEGIAPPAIVGTTATFDATGFELPSGKTLDLSDADAAVESIVIEADSNINVAGNIILTRLATDAVSLTLRSTNNETTPLVFTGNVDGRGSAIRDGGNFALITTNAGSDIICLGTANTSGGEGDTGNDASDAGNITVTSAGDLILRTFGVMIRGGHGSAAGGHGGRFDITCSGEIQAPINWGYDSTGGDGGSGNGGNGYNGVEDSRFEFASGDTTVSSQVIRNGGNSQQGDGGTPGRHIYSIIDGNMTGSLSGTISFTAVGGQAAEAGNGGSNFTASHLWVQVGEATDLRVVSDTRGGDSEDGNGGLGGPVQVNFYDGTNVRVEARTTGGNGGMNGGNGAPIWVATDMGTEPAAMVWEDVRIEGNASGGHGETGNGGNGGEVSVFRTTIGGTDFTATDARVNVIANGGNGSTGGGNGGAMNVWHGSGSIEFVAEFTRNGGSAESGTAGAGGYTSFRMMEGHIDATINSSSANGGLATGTANGGDGDLFPVMSGSSGNPGSMNAGSMNLRINSLDLRGGSAEDGDAGNGGMIGFTCGQGTAANSFFTSTRLTIDASGGNSQGGDGGHGGSIIGVFVEGPADISGGTITLHGGHGGTESGMSGEGGDGGTIELEVHDLGVTWGTSVNANGGDSRGAAAGDGGEFSILLNWNDSGTSGSAVVSGTYNLRGGNALGSGDGGAIGKFSINQGYPGSHGDITFSGNVNATGGSGAGGDGGTGGNLTFFGYGKVVVSGTLNFDGGGGGGTNNGGNGAVATIRSGNQNVVEVNATITVNGGNGLSTSGNGGVVNIGVSTAITIEIQSNARIRANGGTTGATGNAGFIQLSTVGGLGQITVHANAVLETLDGDGTDQSANNIFFS